MEIRTYDPGEWPALRAFISEHWRAGHPYTDRILFQWQFAGFATDRPISRVVVEEGQIAGFLGAIPGLYWANGQVLPGAACNGRIVRPADAAAGLRSLASLEEQFDVCCGVGVNPEFLQVCTARGYTCLPTLHRWIAPLESEGFRRLTSDASPKSFPDIAVVDVDGSTDLQPLRNPDTLAIQIVYERTVEATFRLALHRNAEFWTWRYLRSAGYRYSVFGSVVGPGIVVARIESIISPDRPDLDGRKILRLIELLPTRPETWQGEPDESHLSLLRAVLAWAAKKRCILADFQLSSARLGHLLREAGFVEVSPDAPAAIHALPNRFQPLSHDAPPIHAVWRVAGGADDVAIAPDDVYFARSDGGLDHPDIWPLPPGYA